MTSECHDVMSLLSLWIWIWNHKDCFALVPGMTRARALYPWMVIVNNNKRVKPMAGHSNYTFVHISRHRTRTCCRDVTRETCGNSRLTESFLLTQLKQLTRFTHCRRWWWCWPWLRCCWARPRLGSRGRWARAGTTWRPASSWPTSCRRPPAAPGRS